MFYDDNDLISLFNVRDNTKILNNYDIGFSKGSAFINDYKPYKNYQVFKLEPTNHKEELLLKLYELSFYINDLNLYLDVHKDDLIFKEFKKVTKMYETLLKEYETTYGPLIIESTNELFNWINNMPWLNEGESVHV